MRESGENPEQYPLPYAGEAVVHGVSRSLGAILRRRSDRRGAGAPHPTSRKTYGVYMTGHWYAQMHRGKSRPRQSCYGLPRPFFILFEF